MSRRIRRGRRSTLLLAAWVFALAPAPAGAHAELESSEPPDGAVLDESPERVTARFSNELDTAGSVMTLFAADGTAIETGRGGVDLEDPDHTSMAIAIPAGLGAGRYVVRWRAASFADGHEGHATEGEFSFEVQ
jgi:methionine-rich copper-binding protein CopC